MYALSIKTMSVFDLFSVDGRQKRIKKYAFSNENFLAWMGLWESFQALSNF